MRFGWKRAVSHGIRLLYPPRCVCCDRVVAHNQSLCPACAAALPRIEGKVCPACGREIEFCGRTHRFEFERCVAPFYYLDPIRQGIHLFKFRERKNSAAFFAMEMSAVIQARLDVTALDLIVCVPLSKQRERERGYNQAGLLAMELSGMLALPCHTQALRKLFDNRPQHTLTREERMGNVLGAYEADPDVVHHQRILLVDDIQTTGATLNECAKVLKLRGASQVVAATAAIALKREDIPLDPSGCIVRSRVQRRE